MTVIAMWAHSRSASTAFLRMMIERGDVLVVHEPMLLLASTGEVSLPSADGPPVTVRSVAHLLEHLAALGRHGPVFMKEVLDYPYEYLFEHPEAIAGMTHTFIVRDPRQTIASHYAIKPTVTCPEIGYERLHALFELAWAATARRPLVIRSERLTSEPTSVVREFCERVGLPFLPEALRWQPTELPEWQRYRGWHVDAIHSSGFQDRRNRYPETVDNNSVLRSFYDYHLPFYQRLIQHADTPEGVA